MTKTLGRFVLLIDTCSLFTDMFIHVLTCNMLLYFTVKFFKSKIHKAAFIAQRYPTNITCKTEYTAFFGFTWKVSAKPCFVPYFKRINSENRIKHQFYGLLSLNHIVRIVSSTTCGYVIRYRNQQYLPGGFGRLEY